MVVTRNRSFCKTPDRGHWGDLTRNKEETDTDRKMVDEGYVGNVLDLEDGLNRQEGVRSDDTGKGW